MFCTPVEQKDSVKNIFASANHLSDAFTRSLDAVTFPALRKACYTWFLPPSTTHYNGGLDLKICQNFVGTKFFLRFVRG